MNALLWEVEHGSQYNSESGKKLRKEHRNNPRVALPVSWIDPPKLPLHLEWVGRAFFELSTERQIGMDVGQIPFSKILEYARYCGFSRRRTEKLLFYIQQLDGEYLRWLRARQDKKEPGNDNGNAQKFPKPGKNARKVLK